MPSRSKSYRVLVGLDYLGSRAEPDDVIDDLPETSVPWLLEQGAIEPVKPTKKRGN